MANRIRNVQLKINLTEEEKALFEKKMKLANCKTMSHFGKRNLCSRFRTIQKPTMTTIKCNK